MPCMFSYCSQGLAVNVVCSSVTCFRTTRLVLHVKRISQGEEAMFLGTLLIHCQMEWGWDLQTAVLQSKLVMSASVLVLSASTKDFALIVSIPELHHDAWAKSILLEGCS